MGQKGGERLKRLSMSITPSVYVLNCLVLPFDYLLILLNPAQLICPTFYFFGYAYLLILSLSFYLA